MTKAGQPLKSIAEFIGRFVKWILISLVKLYQASISPYIGSNCRHVPTCSNYMIEAIREWGALKGTWLGIKRIGKCHPWGTSGHDPVPKKENLPDD
jgi:uncharacterized protein